MRELPAATACASSRGHALAPPLTLIALMAAACSLSQQGVPPPLDRISFPGSALVDPDGRWLYVANSNADLRYNNGTLVAVDLKAAAADRLDTPEHPAPWKVCAGADHVRLDSDPDPCCWDFLDHTILDCDERKYIPINSTIEVGSFSAGMVFQSFAEPRCPSGADPDGTNMKTPNDRHDCNTHCPGDSVDGRLFIGVRGNSSLTYVDTSRVPDAALGSRPHFGLCTPSSGGSPSACIVNQMPGPVFSTSSAVVAPTLVPDEPYALTLDPQEDLLYVGHLRGDVNHPDTGGISLFDVSRPVPDARKPTFLGPSASFFNPDGNGNFGITSLTLRHNQVYASSRYGTNVVNVVPSLASPPSCALSEEQSPIVLSGGSDVFTTPLLGAEIRGIQFMSDSRAFVLQRVPPALIGFDTSTAAGAFGNFPSDVIETCAAPTFLQSRGTGLDQRLFVTCFDQDQIYVFDPTVPRLVTIIDAGKGPAGLAFAPSSNDAQQFAYIVGFAVNNIGVLDLTPGSATQYHVIQRLGFPSLVPR